jgi:hypothetical protein
MDKLNMDIAAKDASLRGSNATVEDPWQNRSDTMRCKTCMWFVVKQSHDNPMTALGRCRRHSPTMGGYPVVFKSDWCGDHKLNESII